MSPRPYQLGQRQAAIEQTRTRILNAARELLTEPQGITGFSLDAVAKRADVARMTVYYQFGSKVGLLEALSDMLASQGGMEDMSRAFTQSDAREGLLTYVAIFCRFWETNRLVTRRLNALTELDPELAQVMQARNERRRQGVTVLIERYSARSSLPSSDKEAIIDSLFTLLSFACCDMLAGPARSITDVIPLIQRLALSILALPGLEPSNNT